MKRLIFFALLVLTIKANAQGDLLQQANKAFQNKNWSEAEKLYKAYRENNRSDNSSLVSIAFCEIRLGNYKTAISYADSVILEPGPKTYAIQAKGILARCYSALHDKEKAFYYIEEFASGGGMANVNDTTFAFIRSDPRFKNVSAEIKENGSPCSDKRFHKLDYLIGTWEVYLGKNFDQKVAVDTIKRGAGGCSVFENFKWTSGGNYNGNSMIFFDPAYQKFRMCWAGSSADIRNFEEVNSNQNTIQFLAITNTRQKEIVHRRMTITYNPAEDSVHQYIENSFDLGKTWEADFDAMFRKAK
jgi:tetratricopeptide (TPR) repeat protein